MIMSMRVLQQAVLIVLNSDAISQMITYIPNSKDRTKKIIEYLLEFADEAVHMFQGLLGILEYLYRLRELVLLYDSKVPHMVQEREHRPKKIGCNAPCPCGSGKNIYAVMVDKNICRTVETK